MDCEPWRPRTQPTSAAMRATRGSATRPITKAPFGAGCWARSPAPITASTAMHAGRRSFSPRWRSIWLRRASVRSARCSMVTHLTLRAAASRRHGASLRHCVPGHTSIGRSRSPKEIRMNSERERLLSNVLGRDGWKHWGPYLSERQWGTVREDYSADGTAWEYFPHDHARSRAYRWGEDGLLGITDRECRVCFAPALWNEKDPILKERFFGLTNSEGNHGEDVKELYWYLDATPTASYLKALYKYPQSSFPYADFVTENRRRGRALPAYDPLDTGAFDENRYFDVVVEYAKASADDIFIRLTATNRGPQRAPLQLLPTVWLRNTWAWGRTGEGYWSPGRIAARDGALALQHPSLGLWRLEAADVAGQTPNFIF